MTLRARAVRTRRPKVELTEAVQRIIADQYPDQIPAVVVERAVKRMARQDARQRKAAAS
ncbi:hypothetical protein [Streptomyces sp. NBC_01794]|uniref:hypothetical protein n=1 Tax=Streptomyces sp. NBC_01794 TaxID=2975942 RepID=UPI0030933CA4|nr:hypothetical protein OIE54_12165 [Streptomyces sp. NBC_01794]